ncbi:MAG: hypothetical protein LWW86_03620 [Micrococcales bacterium]|nr:hypothetical protein [Micrococcales bacterium]
MARRATPLPEDLPHRGFSVRQGSKRGLSRQRMRSKEWHRPHWGVRWRGVPAHLHERCRALLTVLPGDAVFSHITAAQLLNLPLPSYCEDSRLLHVMVPTVRPRIRRAGVVGHRGLERRQTTRTRGIPVVGLVDTWCDLAELGDLLDLDDLIVVGDEVARRLKGVEPLAAAAQQRGKARGSARWRAALAEIRYGSRSPTETRTRLLLTRAGISEPELNKDITDAAGEFIATGDLVWAEEKVVIEYLGSRHFGDEGRSVSDVHRRRDLDDLDWTVIEITKRDLATAARREALIRRVAAELGQTDRIAA